MDISISIKISPSLSIIARRDISVLMDLLMRMKVPKYTFLKIIIMVNLYNTKINKILNSIFLNFIVKKADLLILLIKMVG